MAIRDGLTNATSQRLLFRLVISISWFRLASEESDATFRFVKMWMAAEAIDPVLAEHYGINETSGFQGLRRLAADIQIGENVVSDALNLRRHMFHALRTTGDELRTMAQPLRAPLENLIVSSWRVLLDIQPGTLPDESVVPNPTHLKLFAELHHEDATTWGEDHHPYLELKELEFKRVDTGNPRELKFTTTHTHTVRNVEGARVTQTEIWGPGGPKQITTEEGPPPEDRDQAS